MKTYKKSSVKTVKAYQFNGEENDEIKFISHDDYGNVIVPAFDPIKAYFAIKIDDEWKKLKKTDWIVRKEGKILVIKNDVFQLFYEEN